MVMLAGSMRLPSGPLGANWKRTFDDTDSCRKLGEPDHSAHCCSRICSMAAPVRSTALTVLLNGWTSNVWRR
jgi:hypothetical protein